MYRVFLERAAENDLKQLSAQLHNRAISAIQNLVRNPRPAGCGKLTGAEVIGELRWRVSNRLRDR
jgi:mRNA-degrading endonuclease RelE of RelBE toxin-antitoxin system